MAAQFLSGVPALNINGGAGVAVVIDQIIARLWFTAAGNASASLALFDVTLGQFINNNLDTAVIVPSPGMTVASYEGPGIIGPIGHTLQAQLAASLVANEAASLMVAWHYI